MEDTTNSPSLLDYVGDLGNLATKGAQVYNTVTGTGQQPPPAASKPTPSPIAQSAAAYLPWAIGGVLLLLIVGFIFRR